MIIAGTGHRLLIGGWDGYSDDLHTVQRLVVRILDFYRPAVVRTGCAYGFDTAIALAAIKLKIPLHSYYPFPDFSERWSESQRHQLDQILEASEQVITVQTRKPRNRAEAATFLQIRNERLVLGADLVLALWNGSPSGTKNCIEFCDRRHIHYVNLWEHYSTFYTLNL